MTRSIGTILSAVALAAAALLVYGARLDGPLDPEELRLGLQAKAVSVTGRDVEGQFVPLYSRADGHTWLQPFPIVVTAALLRVLPFSESGIRSAAVVFAAANVVLVFFVAMRISSSRLLAVLAGSFLLSAPAHFIHARLAVDAVYPVTCLLLWLFALSAFVEDRRPRQAFMAAALLGLGFYTQPAAVLLTPLYLGLTLWAVRWTHGSLRAYAAAIGGFLVAVAPAAVWLALHPGVYVATLDLWGLHVLDPINAVRSALDWRMLGLRSSLYWEYFSPEYLFFTGGAGLMASTRTAGALLAPAALLLACGVHRIVTTSWPQPAWRVVIVGGLIAPLAACAFIEPRAAGRALAELPFLAVIAAVGAHRLLTGPRPGRVVAVLTLCLMGVQFVRFYDDYFADYRTRSSALFGRNARSAVHDILAMAPASATPPVFLSVDVPDVKALWTFTLIKHQREDLRLATTFVDPKGFDGRATPPGALVLTGAGSGVEANLLAESEFRRVSTTTDAAGVPAFVVLQHLGRP